MIRKVVQNILSFISRFIKVKNIIVFESNPDFSDSSWNLFTAIQSDPYFKDYKCYWITKEAYSDYSDYIIYNSKGMRKIFSEFKVFILLSQAQFYIFTHKNHARFKYKPNQLFLNLTHGTSFKDTRGKHDSYRLSTSIAVTSSFTSKLRSFNYEGGYDKNIITGLPRNDDLYNCEKSSENLMIVWLPTYKTHKSEERVEKNHHLQNEFPLLKTKKDFELLNNVLKENNCILIIKLHPAQSKKTVNLFELSNIIIKEDLIIRKEFGSLYRLLGKSDALLTDYSSVYIDYLLTNNPIGFVVDDYGHNFIIPDAFEYMPGHKINCIEDLAVFIQELQYDKDPFQEERKEVTTKLHRYQDNQSTTRVINYIKGWLNAQKN